MRKSGAFRKADLHELNPADLQEVVLLLSRNAAEMPRTVIQSGFWHGTWNEAGSAYRAVVERLSTYTGKLIGIRPRGQLHCMEAYETNYRGVARQENGGTAERRTSVAIKVFVPDPT